jgi:hypothetical protein
MILSVGSDYEVGRRIGIPQSSVDRHRRNHMLKPAQDRAAILAKGAGPRAEFEELARAAAAGEPSAAELVESAVGARRQVEKLLQIEGRLHRMANTAEEHSHFSGAAAIANAQIRGLEYGSRLSGDRSFISRTSEGVGTSAGTPFSITINLGGTEGGVDKTIKISTVPTPGSGEGVDEDGNRVIEGEADPEIPVELAPKAT